MAGLFAGIGQYRDNIAIIDENDREISFAELIRLAEASVGLLGAGRQLVAIEMANRLECIAAYVGAIGAGHVVILTGPGGADEGSRLCENFAPRFVFCAGGEKSWGVVERQQDAIALHEDLCLLLS